MFKTKCSTKKKKKDNNLDTIELDLLENSGSKLNSSLCTRSVYIKAGLSRRPSSVYIPPKERCSFFLALFSLAKWVNVLSASPPLGHVRPAQNVLQRSCKIHSVFSHVTLSNPAEILGKA